MKKRILFNMLTLTTVSLILVSIILSNLFYIQHSNEEYEEVRVRAELLSRVLSMENVNNYQTDDMRLTVIDEQGVVMYDDGNDISMLENHSSREEFIQALEDGHGESLRNSETLGQQTFYYAIRMENGMVLRLARTTNSIIGVFINMISIVVFVVIIMCLAVFVLATKLTKSIVAPINESDLNKNQAPYEELLPLFDTISKQKEHISKQVDELKHRNETIETLVKSMSEGVVLVNNSGNIVLINDSITKIFDVQENKNGHSILELIRDVNLSKLIGEALDGVRNETNFVIQDKIYRVFLSPVSSIGAIILFLDITDKENAEKMRREFTANVSHELKTPLTIIYGNAQMLEANMVKEEDISNFHGKIKDEARNMITLIEDIMSLSKLDEGVEIEYEHVDLMQITSSVVNSLNDKITQQKVDITLKGKAIFYSNKTHMNELIFNLVDNAVKYNKLGGKVEIVLDSNENEVVILVKDSGTGIVAKDKERIFERFYRGDKSRNKKIDGTGLGLAIVKHIVGLYGGRIELSSDINVGTHIKVSFNVGINNEKTSNR